MQKLLLELSLPSLSHSCPQTLGSLAAEPFLFVPQHQDKMRTYMLERHENSLSTDHTRHDFQ